MAEPDIVMDDEEKDARTRAMRQGSFLINNVLI